MKIVFLITGLGVGGAENQVCNLADSFSKMGHSVLIISLTGSAICIPESEEVKLVELNMHKNALSFIVAYYRATKLIRKFDPDVVHSHMIHANIFSRLLRITCSIPRLICSAHSKNEGGTIRMLAYRVTDKLCDVTTNVSREATDEFIKKKAVRENRIVTMHNGIDVSKFNFDVASNKSCRLELGIGDSLLLLAVGRLTDAKDYPNLLSAFSKLLSYTEKKISLVIIGDGERKNDLEELAINLGVCDKVFFLGMRRDIHKWMSAADLYIMSSAWEGMPTVLIEAMASQRVIVSTDCGGVKELINDFGFLVPCHNSDKLAEAIFSAIQISEHDKYLIGMNARKHVVDNYSLDVVAEKWLRLYIG